MTRYVFHADEKLRYRFPTHTNDLLLHRADAETAEAFMVVLEPGEAPPLHAHHDAEQVFYVLSGSGELQIGAAPGERFPVGPGDLVRIPRNAASILCQTDVPLRYLSVDCFVDGRPSEEPTWESHVRAMCAANGWDYNSVTTQAI